MIKPTCKGCGALLFPPGKLLLPLHECAWVVEQKRAQRENKVGHPVPRRASREVLRLTREVLQREAEALFCAGPTAGSPLLAALGMVDKYLAEEIGL